MKELFLGGKNKTEDSFLNQATICLHLRNDATMVNQVHLILEEEGHTEVVEVDTVAVVVVVVVTKNQHPAVLQSQFQYVL